MTGQLSDPARLRLLRLYYEDAGPGPVVLLHTGGDGRMRA